MCDRWHRIRSFEQRYIPFMMIKKKLWDKFLLVVPFFKSPELLMNILLLARSVLFIHVCGDGGIYILRNMLISPVHMLASTTFGPELIDDSKKERKRPLLTPSPFPLSRRAEMNVTLKNLSEKHMPKKYVHNGRPGERNLVSRIMCFCFFGTRLSFNHF